MSHLPQDLVITGFGAVTASAVGLDAHRQLLESGAVKTAASDYSLASFKPGPHIADKRMLKAVSSVDAIGLAAIEGLAKDMGYKPGLYPAERVGLYVGAPPATSFDNEAYVARRPAVLYYIARAEYGDAIYDAAVRNMERFLSMRGKLQAK